MVYKIIVNLKSDSEEELYCGEIWYSKTSFDKVNISANKIEIELDRKKQKDIENILLNQNSTFCKQINKCMAFIYATSSTNIKIEDIEIYEYNQRKIRPYKYKNINNPIILNKEKIKFTNTELIKIFSNEIEKSESMTISLIFLLKGMTTNQQGEKFENYWKSFNSLYTFISKKKKENEKLYFMKNFICLNISRFKQTLNLLDIHTKNDIRSIRIRDLILNEFPSIKDTEKFKYFILRYTDYRMNEMFNEILPYRIDNLTREGMDTEVNEHIQKYIQLGKKENSDLLCFYILRYSYYLRNKYFHAEKLTPTFNFIKNNENIELDKINELLEMFLYELIKCNDLY